MNTKEVVKYAMINSLGTALYVMAVASFMYFLSVFVGETKSILVPIAMLMLFVFSAALTGILVFGRPIIWYLNGKKKEALSLLAYTLGIFLIITVIVFIVLIMTEIIA